MFSNQDQLVYLFMFNFSIKPNPNKAEVVEKNDAIHVETQSINNGTKEDETKEEVTPHMKLLPEKNEQQVGKSLQK